MNEEIQSARSMNYKSIFLIFLIVAVVGSVILLRFKDSFFDLPGKPLLGKGAPAPNFTLPDLDGKMFSLTDFRGKVILLNIWATWCLPCVEEMPSIEKLHQELQDEGLVILAVSIDEAGAEVVRPFMQKHKLSFSALTDTAGATKSLYQLTGVPESFIIDKNGIVAEKVIGPRDWASTEIISYFRAIIQRN